jgi:hypothetical protein
MSDLLKLWNDVIADAPHDRRVSYLRAPFPNALDEELTTVGRSFFSAAPSDRAHFHEVFDEKNSFLLLTYAERMASLAVHQRDRHRIFEGLVAIAMEGFAFDERDSLMRLAPLYHSAMKLNEDPRGLFDAAAAAATAPVAEAMRGFTRERAPEDRSLEAMGYRESTSKAQPLIYERSR